MTIDLKALFGDLSIYDSKTTAALLKALKENFVSDFDYLRYKQSVRTMIEMGMDEITAIKSAYVTASTMGLTKDHLIKTARHYQSVLSKEKENFAVALRAQMETKIEGKRQDAKKLEITIDDYQKKIAQMHKEIELYQKKIDSVEGEVSKAMDKIEEAKVKFVQAFDGISSVISDDIKQIESIL